MRYYLDSETNHLTTKDVLIMHDVVSEESRSIKVEDEPLDYVKQV